MKNVDLIMSHPNYRHICCTAFDTTYDLQASEMDNSSVNNYSVICIFFLITNWRNIKFPKNMRIDTMLKMRQQLTIGVHGCYLGIR